MTNSEIRLTGLNPFCEQGFSGDVNWFSKTQCPGIAPTVLAQTGLLSCLDEFMNSCVGYHFDALEGALTRGQPDPDGLEEVFEEVAFSLFIPIQEVTKTDWKSIYAFGREALINMDMGATLNSEQQGEDTNSLIMTDFDTTSDLCAALFQVTPLGAIWITVASYQQGLAIKPLLESSRQEITAIHQDRLRKYEPSAGDTTRRYDSTSDSILPSDYSVSSPVIRQLD